MDHQMSLGSASLHAPSAGISPLNILNKLLEKSPRSEKLHDASDCAASSDVSIDLSEVYFLIIHFLSAGPCQKTLEEFRNELLEHQLLPRRYHAWYSRSGAKPAEDDDVRFSFPLGYENLVERYSHIEKDHLIKLLKQLLLRSIPRLHGNVGRTPPTAADVPTLLGTGSFSLLDAGKDKENDEARRQLAYLRWPHMVADQLRGINLREIGGGFTRHHRAPSVRAACYAIAKPTSMLQKMENTKKLRGHRDAVYCAIFDRSGRYVITGSDDRLVKIWSMETAFCLASCRGHEGDITDLAVSSNNALVASASNDFSIRVWRMPDGYPISVLREHTGAVTAIAFSPRPGCSYNLLSSSDDGTCRIWDARYSQHSLRIYLPKPSDGVNGKSNGLSGSSVPSSSNNPQSRQILCCAYNANGSVFVTGSSDTYARVWNACRSNTEQPDQPVHEMDVLSGHEDDVNYVQFSGCAVAAKCSIFDSIKEEKSTKFKNSWFCHDNIVTCSRDGSAIIWIPRSRRSHGKAGRWTRAYHLKVPPPPMPPKPPRGGPRQRFLPTPRGVNMIIWSLDNRFVLAAIMDCRICVWNAADGSLVHSLTGHSQSTYVLDVHPFNPRIAMSAGYDGKTIVWDIWEGTPIRVYEIGHFKLVDGKFSPDGMSIVLSDDVGQIYLLSTGQGESQKDAKYDQFFLGDYRPLIRDANGNVIDQESQLVPYQRNIQDLLCDPSMIPYDEPYQSTYQKRRLGALNLEWRHPVIKFAIGPAATLEDYQLLPLAELEPLIDPVVEFNDTFFWEPEIEIHDDDTDPEYNVTEENATDAEQGSLSAGSFSHSDYNSEDSQNENSRDGLCRSRKKKDKFKVELVTSSGRHVKRKITNEDGDTLPGSSRTKKAKSSRRASKRRSLREKLSRPQRVAARNALNTFVQATVISTDDDNGDSLEDDSSDSDVMLQDSNVQSSDSERTVHTALQKFPKTKQLSFETFPQVAKSPELVSVSNSANKKRLILKISMRDSKKNEPPEETNINGDGPSILVCSSSQPPSETTKEKTINVVSRDPWSTDFNTFDGGSSENYDSIQSQKDKDSLSIGVHGKDNDTRCEELKDLHELAGLDLRNMDVAKMTEVSATDDSYRSSTFGESVSLSLEPKDNPPLRSAKLRIKMKKVSQEVKSPSKLKFVTSVGDPSIEEKSSDYGDHDGDSENMWPNSVSDATRRTRSKSLKEIALGKSAGRLRESVETASDEDILPTIEKFTSPDWVVCSKVVGRSRSSRNRNGNACGDGPSTSSSRNSNVQMRESSWLLLTEHEKAYRYIPQLGDEVIYLRQGHQEYIKASQSSEVGPWRSIKGIRAVEICEIANLVYSTHRGSGEGCCKLTLRFVDPFSDVSGRTFKLTLPELNDFPDFVIEKTWYDASIQRNWSIRDKCFVWWRDDSQEGGTWWEGRIIAVGPKDPEFPDSPWERYSVRYKSEGSQDPETHSPWELHSSRNPPIEQPCIDKKIRGKVLGAIYNAEASDGSGIAKLNEVARKLDYLNRFPVPLYPEVIVSRLEKNYYRRFEALEHDVAVMMSNAESYFSRNNAMSEKMARLSKRFSKILSRV